MLPILSKFLLDFGSQSFSTQSRLLTTLKNMRFENIVGYGENAGNQHFLLFQQCFLLHQNEKLLFLQDLICGLPML